MEEAESMIDDRSSQRAIIQRFKNIPQDLKKRIDERDENAIISFIESDNSNINENFKCTVLQLTIQNDPETLKAILTWGDKIGLTPATGKDDCQERHNPILVSCQQNFKTCMEYLYQHGYRMKDINNTDKDQVKRFLIFKASSNIHYLSLEFTENKALQNKQNAPELTPEEDKSLKKVDPVRRVYKMMTDADDNMEDFHGSSELKCNYIVIKKELEAFLGDILTQCEDMQEVKTILDYNPDDDDDDELDDSDTNWQVALYKGHRHLVSHPNFQQYIWRKMTGDGSMNTSIPFEWLAEKVPNVGSTTKFRMKRALWNLKNIPLTILSFLFCYTVVVLADLFRKGDILFVTPHAMKKRESKKKNKDIEKPTVCPTEGCLNRCFDYFRNRMHIPLFRMIPYFFIHVTYLILLCVSIWNPVEPVKANFTDTNNLYAITMMVTFIIAFNFLVDDIINLFRPQHRQHQSCWSLLSLISHLLLVGGALIAVMSYHFHPESIKTITSLADISGNHPINVGMVMLSFGAGMEFFGILRWLLLLETTGPIVLCVISVIRDALRMVSIYVVIFVAHGIAFWSLYKPFRPDSTNKPNHTRNYTLAESAKALKTERGLISTLFWRIIASSGPELVNIKNTNDMENDFSMEFSHLMGLVLWGLYQIIIYILMLNLLIAVMNTSYSKLWQNVEVEWKYNKSQFQAQFLDPLQIFPVPFRWNYYLAKNVYNHIHNNVKDASKQDNWKYYSLLRLLILNKKEAEYNKSIYTKNDDLKMDIINELKKLKTLK